MDADFMQYIALERLESIYKSCNLVSNICVHATQDAKQPIAIIIPHEAHLRAALPDSKKDVSLHDLCEDKEVHKLVLAKCNEAGKKNQFKPLELLEAVVLTAEEWTPESGLVTAAQKVQRKKVAEKFDKEIKVRPLFSGDDKILGSDFSHRRLTRAVRGANCGLGWLYPLR